MNLMTITQFAERYPAFSQSALEALIRGDDPSIGYAIIRPTPKKWFIDEDALLAWLERKRHIKLKRRK